MVPVAFGWILIIVLATRLIAAGRLPRATTSWLLLLFFFMVGGVHGTANLQPPDDPRHLANIVTSRLEASVAGTLLRSPEIGPEKTSLLMEATEILFPDGTTLPARGLVKLSLRGVPPADILPGQLFLARAQLSPVFNYGVPGAFDYKSYLSYQAIWTTGWIKSPALLKRLHSLDQQPLAVSLRFLPERARYKINQALALLDQEQTGIYQAIITGDRSSLDAATLENFKASGIVHLLAISGMHMGLLALCATMALSFLLKRSQWILLHLPARKVAAGLSLFPLLAYALIAGFHPPVVRALIMVTVFIAALLVDRQWHVLNNVAIAALVILGIKPALLFTASFQLSFGAVSAIALFAPALAAVAGKARAQQQPEAPLKAILARLRHWGLFSLLLSLAAFLGTAPILAYHFHRISLISPLATLAVEPFLCLWALLLGLAACLFLPFSPQAADLLWQLGGLGITISTQLASFFASLPYSSIWLPTPGIVEISAWYAVVILLANAKKIPAAFLLAGSTVCVGLAVAAFLHSPPVKTSRVSVLDVGQGSAIVLELPGQQTFLLDGGKKPDGPRQTFNIGESLIAPFLWKQQVSKLKAVIISHAHADHYNGLPFILKNFQPETIWLNSLDSDGLDSDEARFQELLDLAKAMKIPVRTVSSATTIYQAEAVRLTAFTTRPSSVATGSMRGLARKSSKAKESAQNNQGLLLRLEHGERAFLFPGDIEEEAEQSLSQHSSLLQAEVLVAAHHGSATSNSRAFLATVNPKYVAVSAGRHRPDLFPAPSSMARFKDLNIQTWLTASDGSIFFETDGEFLQADSFY